MKEEIKANASRNCQGVSCPMNMVYAKVELSKMQPGQVLKLILDDGPPINNVPDSIIMEGHKILDRKQLKNGTWQVLVEKGSVQE